MASNVDAKLLKSTKFPAEFNQKVDMQKVNVEVMKKWIAGRISDILGNEDDVVIELCFNLLEGSRNLTGFLDKDTAKFCKELWLLCLSAQSNPQGVPKELLEAKKLELIQEKIDAEKAAEDAQRRREQERQRDRNIESIRQRERGDRGGRGRGRSDRGSYRDFDRRPLRDSRSPPPRRRSPPGFRGPPPPRETDTYIPPGRAGRRSEDRRRRSPSSRRSPSYSRSRSRTPPRRRHEDYNPPRPRRRYSPNRSRTPPRRDYGRDRDLKVRGRGDERIRSYTPSDTSRSRSPRKIRRRHSPTPSTRSPTPPPRAKYYGRRRPSSTSLSSRSTSRDRRPAGRSRKSPSYNSDDRRSSTRADYRKGPRNHHDRRRSRSRSRSRSRERLSPVPATLNKSPTSPRQRGPKRRRSLQRYAPAGRRRRNTSSVSSPVDKRRKTADSSADEDTEPKRIKTRIHPAEADRHAEDRSPTLTATELREKLLREKVKASRKSNSIPKEVDEDGA
ncbi:hypothetical protein BDR22DRAFT_822607 [Usnea florida]